MKTHIFDNLNLIGCYDLNAKNFINFCWPCVDIFLLYPEKLVKNMARIAIRRCFRWLG